MHKLNAALGMPQHRFASIHVVGTNGKSSVTRMTAALLEAHGVRAGACVSPHVERWAERVLIGSEPIGAAAFAAAVETTAAAVEGVNRSLANAFRPGGGAESRSRDGEGEPGPEVLTQFEVSTAASFLALARARVKVGVIEAGLGGRLDATNTIPSRVTVLTSVGLDHTEWLGESVEAIAAEKLAVLRDHSTLVLGRVPDPVREMAERAAAERGARLVVAPEDPGEGLALRSPGRFQRRNFALACAAAEVYLGALDRERVAEVAAELTVPGRLERVADEPPTYLDVAHNPDGAAALAEALPDLAAGAPVVACLAMLADKDAAAFAAALAPALARVVCTEVPATSPADGPICRHIGDISARRHRRGMAAGELAAACAAAGLEVEEVSDFRAAVARARELARQVDGLLLATGSHYVLGPARSDLSA